MCVSNLSKVALDSAAAGFEPATGPATSSRKSNALTTAPPSAMVQKKEENKDGKICS